MTATLDAEGIAGEFLESARAAAARGEGLQTLGLAHLRTAMILLTLANPAAGQALSQAVTRAASVLALVADDVVAGQAERPGAE